MKRIRLLSFYSGYGGAEFSLEKAQIPFECLGYSEYDKRQIRIYEQNHKGIKNYGDITKINPKDLPDCDLITGGFPCQDVSMAGLRDLTKGRTNTVFKLLDIIKEKKPKYCLLENVEGILSMLNGQLLLEIIRQLKNLGYAVSYKLLKSKDHGTPQNRPRVWIACELGRQPFGFNPFPKKEELKLKVSDLLEDEVGEEFYLTDKQIKAIIRSQDKAWGTNINLRINPNISTTLTTKDPKCVPNDNIIILKKDIAGTITSGDYSKQVYKNQYIVDDIKGARVLTPKECFRLQGFFNDEINIDEIPKTNTYFSAGNGWDINLVSKIFSKWFKR